MPRYNYTDTQSPEKLLRLPIKNLSTPCMVVNSGKSWGSDRNERLRAFARELLETRFGGNKTRLAEAMRVSQPTVTNFINGKSGAGPKLADALSRAAGVSLAQILGQSPLLLPEPGSTQPKQRGRDQIRARGDAVDAATAAFEAALKSVSSMRGRPGFDRLPTQHWLREIQLAYEREIGISSDDSLVIPSALKK